MRLSELAYFTDDVEGMTSFYERLLGVKPVHCGEGIAIFDVNSVRVLIHRNSQTGPDDVPCENHVAFAVPELDRAVRELEIRGLNVEFPPRQYDWGRSAYLRAPDSLLVELHESDS